MLKRTRLAAAFMAAALIMNMAVQTAFAAQNSADTAAQPEVSQSVSASEPASSQASSSQEQPASSSSSASSEISSSSSSSSASSESSSASSTLSAIEETDETELPMLADGTPTLAEVQAAIGSNNYTMNTTKFATINIQAGNAGALILLSNYDAAAYQNAEIKFSFTGDLDITSAVIVTSGTYTFQGLGSDTVPFKGSITDTAITNRTIVLNTSLFKAISNNVTIHDNMTLTLKWRGITNAPVFAKKVVFNTAGTNPSWKFEVQNINSEAVIYTIGGLVGSVISENSTTGTLALTTNLSDVANARDITTVTYAGDAGLVCGALGAGITLDVSGITFPTNYTVSATGSAGGIVGSMASGSTLKSTKAVTLSGVTVTGTGAGTGAGGIVGSADNPVFDFGENAVSVTGSTMSGAANVGGLVGIITNGGNITINDKYTATDSTLTPSSEGNAGGLFGSYASSALSNTLTINADPTSSLTTAGAYYGGLIGQVGASTYVKIENVTEQTTSTATPGNFGGITAYASINSVLDVGTITVKGRNNTNGGLGGGLVGEMKSGAVLKLSGITTLANLNTGDNSNNYGQFVGKQDSSLIYTDDASWASNLVRTARITQDDIGNYGEVIRNTAINNLIKFNSTSHVVELDSAKVTNASYVGDVTIGSSADFAALAIAVQSRNTFSVETSKTDGLMSKNITMTADIDLTGTGLICLTRDNGDDTYNGTFNGGDFTLTLDIGTPYGKEGSATAAVTTTQGVIYYHNYIGLFGKTNNATVQNMTIAGNINIRASSGIELGGVSGRGTGKIILRNVTSSFKLTNNISGGTGSVKCGGFIGSYQPDSNNTTLTVEQCTFNSTIENTTSNDFSVGGLVGYVQSNNAGNTVSLTNNTINGSISSSAGQNKWAGGVFGYLEGKNNATVNINVLNINGFKLNVKNGGLLGYKWDGIKAELKDVTVSGNTVLDFSTANDNFGGLLYEATGKIAIVKGTTGVTIKDSFFKSNANAIDTDAMLVRNGTQLYLSVPKDAYTLKNNDIIKNGNYLDELVGYTNPKADKGGIVSITTAASDKKIDTGGTCSTYKNQLGTAYTNPNARYYYNLENIFKEINITDGKVDSSDKLMLWSIRHYAADKLLTYFPNGANAYTISGTSTIDMSNYSYYPVTVNGDTSVNNATITFDNKTIETAEAGNKLTTATNSQHFGMQSGLFGNVGGNLNVDTLTLSGNIGKSAPTIYANSAALIAGYAYGNGTLNIKNIILHDLYINGVADTNYAPLLINRIEGGTKLYLSNVSTSRAGAVYDMGGQAYAASSLIGAVGSSTATQIVLSFSGIKLDARTAADNNTAANTAYGTTKSIFSRATLLDEFQYASDSSGTYNFNEAEDWNGTNKTYGVTYGKEITMSLRNAAGQRQYYDTENYVHPTAPPDTTAVAADFTTGYLPYVYSTKVKVNTLADSYKEIDVNVKIGHLLTGCGTYAHPYKVDSAQQFSSLYKFLSDGSSKNLSKWVVTYNSAKAFCTGNQAYDLQYEAGGDENWYQGTYDAVTKQFTRTTGAAPVTDATMLEYMRNAYYQVTGNIKLSANFSGLGTNTNPFCGVIVGKVTDNVYPTIEIPATSSLTDFGGLIKVSYGSVVKNINIKYNAQAVVNKPTNNTTTLSYFGGIIGDVEGGDNIIDNVNITYHTNGIKLTGFNTHLITAGGYVGIIKAGGVVFKNMSSTTGLQKAFDANGAGADVYIANEADAQSDASHYYYANPYVGRVLDGFAVYEQGTGLNTSLDNTDKNYKIPTLITPQTDADKLSFTDFTNVISNFMQSDVTINNSQNLLVLSMIISSGAGSYGGKAKPSALSVDTYEAPYSTGKVRNASYDNVGSVSASTDADYMTASTKDELDAGARDKYSYLITYYVKSSTGFGGQSAARRLTGAYTRYNFNFASASFDLSSYGNGFRGINTRYDNAMSGDRTVVSLHDVDGNNQTVKLNINVRQYENDTFTASAVGLFNKFYQNKQLTATTVQYTAKNLTITGKVSITRYTNAGAVSTTIDTIGVGGFAGSIYGTKNTKCYPRLSSIKLGDGTEDSLVVSGMTYAGGIVGRDEQSMDMVLTECSYNGIKIEGGGYAGGLVGYATKPFTVAYAANSTNILQNGKIYALGDTGGGGIGGVAGRIRGDTTTITNARLADLYIYASDGNNSKSVCSGGVVGVASCKTVIDGVEIYATTGKSFQLYSGNNSAALIGESSNASEAKNCKINSGENAKGKLYIKGYNRASAGVGYLAGNKFSFTSSDIGNADNSNILLHSINMGSGIVYGGGTYTYTMTASAENVNMQGVLAYSAADNGKVGGIYTDEPEGTSIGIANIKISKCTFVTKNNGPEKAKGCLIGKLNGKLIGSNILLQDNILGTLNSEITAGSITNWIANTDTIDITSSNIKSNTTYTGLFVGNFADTANVRMQLSGVNRSSTNITSYPIQQEIGNKSGNFNDSATATSTSSYIVYADYGLTFENTTGSSPYVTTNPSSGITLTNTDNSTVLLTGDGTVRGDASNATMANRIINENKTGTVPTRYTSTTVASFAYSDNVTTYNTYNAANTALQSASDFPVLKVNTNKTADVDKMVAAYADVLTNGGFSKARSALKVAVKAQSYELKDKSFSAASDTSMEYVNNQFKVTSSYDNTKARFTLLSITFDGAYTLYVPVIVEKTVDVKATAQMLNSAVFNESAFANSSEVLVAHGEQFTMLLTYEYDYFWQTHLENGGSLMWGYNKTLGFGANLPSGTKITLVDANNTDKAYYTTLTADASNVDFTSFKSVTDKNTAWEPSAISNNISVTPTLDNTNGTWAKENDTAKQQFVYNGQGYRLAINTDAEKYAVKFSNDANGMSKITEKYYILLETPSTAYNHVNMNITSSLPSGSLPTKWKTESGFTPLKLTSGAIYTSIQQTLTDASGTEVKKLDSKGDTVTLTLRDKITIDETYKGALNDSAKRYLQFAVNLQQVNNETKKLPNSIPSGTLAKVSFKVYDSSEKSITVDGLGTGYEYSINSATSELTLLFGDEYDSPISITSLLINYGVDSFTVEATIELSFGEKAMEVFPAYTDEAVEKNSKVPPSHVQFNSTARISSAVSTLPSSGTKTSAKGNVQYYRGEEAGVKLKYNASGDVNQLGINVSDLQGSTDRHVIETQAIYDISNAVDINIDNADSLVCAVKLYKKENNGSYVEIANPQSYISLSGGVYNGNALTWTIAKGLDGFGGAYNSANKTFTLPFNVNVTTDIEKLNGTYANYKVLLDVKLTNRGEDVTGSSTNDYFKYTMARISTELLGNG